MNYNKIYASIVLRAQAERTERLALKKQGQYFENHHIIPRSLGGKNTLVNMALLTAREHFICHWLLVKIYKKGSAERNKMLFALWRMNSNSSNYTNRYVNSRSYENLRIEYSHMVGQMTSQYQSGKGNSQYGKTWYTNAYNGISIPSREPLIYPWFKGRGLFHGESMVLFTSTQQDSMLLARNIWDSFHLGNYASFSEFTRKSMLPIKRTGVLALFNKYIPISRTLWKDSTKPKCSNKNYVGKYY